MATERAELLVEVEGSPDVDREELAELSGRLRGELLELDVDRIDSLPAADVPGGAKGPELLAVGPMLLHMAPTLLVPVARGVLAWLRRQGPRTVKLTLGGDTLELSGVSSADQEHLIELWVAQHASNH